jgi:hypothetical protein
VTAILFSVTISTNHKRELNGDNQSKTGYACARDQWVNATASMATESMATRSMAGKVWMKSMAGKSMAARVWLQKYGCIKTLKTNHKA